MNSCILLSHVFIRPDESEKLEILEFTTDHFRKHNPNAYIILTGHGLRPKLKTVNHLIWNNDINEKEIDKGHPELVNLGLDHALLKGFDYVLKTRADGVHLLDNILEFSHFRLKDKSMLITQQTKRNSVEMGDLFLYGNIKFIKECWNLENWYPTKSGLISLGKNFLNYLNGTDWNFLLQRHCSFVDIYNLKWIDFRANWQDLKSQKKNLLENQINDLHKYLWGYKENWCRFDSFGNFIPNKKYDLYTEENWNESYSSQRKS